MVGRRSQFELQQAPTRDGLRLAADFCAAAIEWTFPEAADRFCQSLLTLSPIRSASVWVCEADAARIYCIAERTAGATATHHCAVSGGWAAALRRRLAETAAVWIDELAQAAQARQTLLPADAVAAPARIRALRRGDRVIALAVWTVGEDAELDALERCAAALTAGLTASYVIEAAEGQHVEARRALARREAILAHVDDPAATIRASGQVTYANDAFCQFVGLTPIRLASWNLFNSLLSRDEHALRAQLAQLDDEQPRGVCTVALNLPGGTRADCAVRCQAIRNEDGRAIEYGLLFHHAAASARLDDQEPHRPAARPAARLRPGATVLVIDDEEVIREVVEATLTARGVRVLLADDGPTGLRVFEEHIGGIDVVLLDLCMPEMSGREVLDRLRAIDPHVRVILSSGADQDDERIADQAVAPAGFVQKPYRPETLLAAIGAAIGE